jgi:hypothetical protein
MASETIPESMLTVLRDVYAEFDKAEAKRAGASAMLAAALGLGPKDTIDLRTGVLERHDPLTPPV